MISDTFRRETGRAPRRSRKAVFRYTITVNGREKEFGMRLGWGERDIEAMRDVWRSVHQATGCEAANRHHRTGEDS